MLSNQAREALVIALANAAWGQEVADAIDADANPVAAFVALLGSLDPTARVGGIAAQYSVSVVADSAGSLNGKYFELYDQNGSVVFWIDETGTTPQPAVTANRFVRITTIVSGDNAGTVASKLATAIGADAQFTANAYKSTLAITDRFKGGPRTAPSSGTSGFTVTQTQAGENQASDAATVDARISSIQVKVDAILSALQAAGLMAAS